MDQGQLDFFSGPWPVCGGEDVASPTHLVLSATPAPRPASFLHLEWLTVSLIYCQHGSAQLSRTQKPQKWNDHMEEQLKDFMIEHDFMRCSKKKGRDQTLLGQISNDLRAWFDPTDWRDEVHEPALREKVLNKMHRIRNDLANQDSIRKLEDALENLLEQDYEKALHLVISRVGPETAQTALEIMLPMASSWS